MQELKGKSVTVTSFKCCVEKWGNCHHVYVSGLLAPTHWHRAEQRHQLRQVQAAFLNDAEEDRQ